MAKKKKISKRKKVQEPGIYDLAIKSAASYFREGFSEQKSADLVKSNYPQLTQQNVQLVLYKASNQIAEQFVKDRKSIVAIHVRRYDQEVKGVLEWMDNEEYEEVDPRFQTKTVLNKLECAVDSLIAKERVLQIHNKETQVRIFNKLNAKVKKVMFDLSPLSLQEKIELLNLMSKAKKSDLELMGVVLRETDNKVQSEEIQDAEFEVVNTNINQIKRVNEEEVVIERVPKKKVTDLTDLIKKTLEKQAEKEFKNKGAKQVAPAIIDRGDDILRKSSKKTSHK